MPKLPPEAQNAIAAALMEQQAARQDAGSVFEELKARLEAQELDYEGVREQETRHEAEEIERHIQKQDEKTQQKIKKKKRKGWLW